MAKNKASSATAIASEIQRWTQFCAISQELSSLIGQSRTKVLRHLFSALVRNTDVQFGQLFLANDKGLPEYCLVLTDKGLKEHDKTTAPPLHEQGLTGWVFRNQRQVLITDFSTDSRQSLWSESFNQFPAGSALAIPLLVANQPIGAIALVADQAHQFTEMDLALVNTLADQTAIILENVRLERLANHHQKTIESLHQTARAINISADLEQTLYSILDQLNQAIPHHGATILLREEERLYTVTLKGFATNDGLSRSSFEPADSPTIFQALRQGRVLVGGPEQKLNLSDLVPENPIHSWMIAPLKSDPEILGLVILFSHQSQAYTPEQATLINAFADHIVVAVSYHRLVQETGQRLRELAFLNETGQAITSTLNLDRILQLLLERVRELLKIDAASIALKDEQTGDLVFEAASGKGATGVLGIRLKPGQGIAGWVAESGKALVVPDVYKDTRFFPDVDRKTGMTTQAILCVPIVLKGQVVGVIQALNPGQVPFDNQAVELLNALAGLAATAIDNARLFAQVRSAEARYEGLFEDSVNPIIITDLKGVIVDANRNACSLLGQAKASLLGTNLTQLRSAEDRLDFVTPHKEILSGRDVTFKTDVLSQGNQIAIEVNGKQVSVKGLTFIQWIGRNISAELELEQAREDMVRMIIHDLRNPLANIMNSLDVLHDVITEKDNSVSQLELVNIAKRSGQRLHQLISSILDISRLETGQAILETKPTDLIPVLLDALEFVKPQADIREIQLTHDFAARLPTVEIDRDMISRVILNLLDNAIKFTPVGGKVHLAAYLVDKKIEVRVNDNGLGIPPDQLKIIFEKFVRVHRANGPKGTGLGLAFCQLAIRAHGGHIWAKSTLGKGSTFYFSLPLEK